MQSAKFGQMTEAWMAEGVELSVHNDTALRLAEFEKRFTPVVRPFPTWQAVVLAVGFSLAVVGIVAGIFSLPAWISYWYPAIP
jgi:hypothetical protein